MAVRFLCFEVGHAIEQTYEIWKKSQNGEEEKVAETTSSASLNIFFNRSFLCISTTLIIISEAIVVTRFHNELSGKG